MQRAQSGLGQASDIQILWIGLIHYCTFYYGFRNVQKNYISSHSLAHGTFVYAVSNCVYKQHQSWLWGFAENILTVKSGLWHLKVGIYRDFHILTLIRKNVRNLPTSCHFKAYWILPRTILWAMPRSGIRIKFLRFGFFLLIKGLMFIVVKWETGRSADSTTQVDIDKEHYKEKNAKCNTQIKDETLAHIASGANLVDIYIWKKNKVRIR